MYTLLAAPAQAAQASSNLTVRIVPSQTLRFNPLAASPLQLTHNSGTDLKITAECAPSLLCGGRAGVQDLYTQIPAGTLNGAFAYTALAAQREGEAFTVTYTSVEQ